MSDLCDYVNREKWFQEDEQKMLVWPKYAEELKLHAEFEVCQNCGGRGSHSKHLGSFTSEEFEETFWDDGDREDYFRGGYDMQCEICRGKRVVLVPSKYNSKQDLEAWNMYMADMEYDRRTQLREMGLR